MSTGQWTKRDLLGLEDLTPQEIETILQTATSFKQVSARDVKKVPALRGKTVVMLFSEPSTRTRASFELAAKRLSADTISLASGSSSLTKGETLVDTARNMEAMNVSAIVVRHESAGVPKILARHVGVSVINAGDGCREHPTQALLDMFTIKEKLGRLAGLRVAIVGDILHSRVARSNVTGLSKLGAEVTVCVPATLMPEGIEAMGARVAYDLREVVKKSDVLMVLRLQRERQRERFLPSIREYARMFGVRRDTLALAKKDLLIMHPGPTNRGVELSADVADGDRSVILDQVTNGIAIRMAVLYLLLGARKKEEAA